MTSVEKAKDPEETVAFAVPTFPAVYTPLWLALITFALEDPHVPLNSYLPDLCFSVTFAVCVDPDFIDDRFQVAPSRKSSSSTLTSNCPRPHMFVGVESEYSAALLRVPASPEKVVL